MTYSDEDFAQMLEHELEANEASHMLQPYVDGELSEDERTRVADHLERSADARRYVQRQQEVRTLLQGLEPARAPERLRVRVSEELDRIDAAREVAASGGGGRLVRLRSAFRGAMIMMPAAAAAVGLFFVVKSGALMAPPGAENGAGLQGSTAALIERAASPRGDTVTGTAPADPANADARGPAPELAADGPRGTDLDADGIDFPRDFVAPAALPEGVRLVSASREGARDAASELLTVEYVDRDTGARYIDVQRPRHADEAGVDASSDDAVVSVDLGGIEYQLRRDSAGRALVRFSDARVDHTLRHRGSDRARVDGPVAADEPDFAELLGLAQAVSTPRPR